METAFHALRPLHIEVHSVFFKVHHWQHQEQYMALAKMKLRFANVACQKVKAELIHLPMKSHSFARQWLHACPRILMNAVINNQCLECIMIIVLWSRYTRAILKFVNFVPQTAIIIVFTVHNLHASHDGRTGGVTGRDSVLHFNVRLHLEKRYCATLTGKKEGRIAPGFFAI